MRSLYTKNIDTWTPVRPTLLQGLPISMFFIPLSMIILSGLHQDQIPAAAKLANFVRIFCGAIGTSITIIIWNNSSIFHHAQLTEQATLYNADFTDYINETSSLLAITKEQSYDLFDKVLVVQNDMLGINNIFWISSLVFIASIPLVWLTKPGKITENERAISYE